MLTFSNISKTFKPEAFGQSFTALKNVSFSIPEGSMVGFLGANGAGKTTSLKIIMDFIRPDQGEVSFSPKLGTDRQNVFKNIGFLPERPYFYPNLTGLDFLSFMGRLSEVSDQERKLQIKRWAPRFQIEFALNRQLKTYSKGMLQRIGFLATILHHPKLIILDEPLSGLDPIGRKELKDVIVEVHKEGKTVFFSSHIVPDIEEICDRVIFLKQGQLVYDGSVSSLLYENTQMTFVLSVIVRNPNYVYKTPIRENMRIPGDQVKMIVAAEHKNALIAEISSCGDELIRLDAVRPNLEEIFYKTKERQ